MQFRANQGPGRGPSDGEDPRVKAFWERYTQVLQGARIAQKRHIWFRRACERFIAWLQPTRLLQTQRQQVLDYLAYLEGMGLERWQLEQASEALRYLLAEMEESLARKYPNAPREWAWQWVFPADRLALDPRSGKVRRHHLHPKWSLCLPDRSRQQRRWYKGCLSMYPRRATR